MKSSVTLSIIILTIAAVLGLRLEQRLATARNLNQKLASEAANSGISTNSMAQARPHRFPRRQRKADENPDLLAADFIAVSWDLKMLRDSGAEEDTELMRRFADLRIRMGLLNFKQAIALIAKLEANGYLLDDDCQKVILSLLNDLAVDHPQGILAFLMESPDLLKSESRYELIHNAIFAWSKEDPFGAFDWIHKNSVMFPVDSAAQMAQAEEKVVYGAAVIEPKLAFEILAASEIENQRLASARIMEFAKTSEARTAALTAYLEYVGMAEDEKDRKISLTGIDILAECVTKNGFVDGSQWLAGAALTTDEITSILDLVPNSVNPGERAQWIEWIDKTLPANQAQHSIAKHVKEWVWADREAANEWFAAQAESPARSSAIEGFAFALSRTDPETAAAWVKTIPPGKDRDQAIRSITRCLQWDGPEGSAAFDRAIGIDPRW